MSEPLRGEVYLSRLPGEEKERPAVVVSPDPRNRLADDVMVVPMTTAARLRGQWAVRQSGGACALKYIFQPPRHRITKGSVSCSSSAAISRPLARRISDGTPPASARVPARFHASPSALRYRSRSFSQGPPPGCDCAAPASTTTTVSTQLTVRSIAHTCATHGATLSSACKRRSLERRSHGVSAP
ncbi:MAG: type II toxin-antitoxin system PemK/MazF family toxin, partial [Armatimonadetes bacterium]|nr:type II toxin-antitoxin system PemK/MazF family toxin [Armatimonadota bacterium]